MKKEQKHATQPEITLSTGKKIAPTEWEEIRELVRQQDDEEDIRFIVKSGVMDSLLPFEIVPEECIKEIAARKSVLQKSSCSRYYAARLALLEWCNKERESLQELFSSFAPESQEEPEHIQPLL